MRLSHLAAVATLVALLGAMFLALPSAGAQTVLAECVLVQGMVLNADGTTTAGEDDAVPCMRTIPGSGELGTAFVSGSADILATDSPSVAGRVVTFTPAEPVAAQGDTAADPNTGSAMYRIIASNTNGVTLGTYEIKVTTKAQGKGDETEDTSSISPNFKISFVGDSDNIVSAGGTVDVKVEAANASLTRVTVSGGLNFYERTVTTTYAEDNTNTPHDADTDLDTTVVTTRRVVGSTLPVADLGLATNSGGVTWTTDSGSDEAATIAAQDVSAAKYLELAVPVGTAPGEYTVSAIGTYQRGTTTHTLVKTAMLTVGDTVEVETVTFDLSSPRRTGLMSYVPGAAPAALNPKAVDEVGGPPNGTGKDGYEDDASTRESAIISVGSANNTEFSLSILNRSGKPSEASAITSIVISTTGGSLQAKAGQNYECDAVRRTRACEIDISTYADAGDPLPSKIRVLLSAPETPGTAEVRAVVVAGGQVHAPDPVTITFYGPLAELSLSEPSGTLLSHHTNAAGDDRDMIKFTVNATDADDNAVRTPNVGVKITDPDGVTVSPSKYMVHRSGALNHILELDNDTAKASAWKTGDYEITISQGALSQKVMFAVVGLTGKDEGVDLSVDNEAPDMISAKVVATAMVTDDNGNAVADGTMVRFTSRDTTGDSDSVLVLASDRDTPTKGGEAKATFVVIGPGSAVVTASADDQVDVAVVASTAGAPEPVVAPEPEPEVASVDCLSNLSGFSTWTCGVDADVSEIFTMVSERGVTAIHLWNGTNWVRYSVVGGSEVPGSSDFMVTKTDILYISQ